MPARKNQHFVPKCYLKLFATNKGLVNIFLLQENQLKTNIPYSSQCQLDFFYGKEMFWENILSILESDCAPIFKRIIDDADYYPSSSEISVLRHFVIFQRSRTEIYNEIADKQRTQTFLAAMKMKLEHQGIPYSEEVLQNTIESFLDTERDVVLSSLEIANDIQGIIDDLGFVLINYDTGLITSDNPIVLINPFTPSNIGYANLGLIIFFPIGSTTLAVFYDKKLYPNLCDVRRINCENKTDVITLNAYQYIFGSHVLIGTTNEMFNMFISPLEEYSSIRKKIKAREPTTVFGNNNHKLIIARDPSILLDQELSFYRLLSDARKIPLYCREPIPRTRDDAYYDKIRMRSVLYPETVKSVGQPIDLAKYKEFRQGIQRMEYLANKYWR